MFQFPQKDLFESTNGKQWNSIQVKIHDAHQIFYLSMPP